MFRTGKLTCLAVGAAGLAVAFTTFTVLAQGVAMAAAGGGPSATFALMAAPPKTFTDTYSCDLSAYVSGSSPVTFSATTVVPATAATLTPVDVTLKTASVALPAAVLSKLSGVTSFGLTASVTAKQDGVSFPAPLAGQSTVSGTLAGLPAVTATTSADPSLALVFDLPGSGQIEVPPPSLTFTPNTATTSLTPITCTTSAATQDVTVTVAVGVIGKTGPLYDCVLSGTVSGITVKLEEFHAHVPMSVKLSGTRTTGKTDTVALTAGIGDFYPQGATSAKFSATLPVTGAQAGNVAMSEPVTNLTSLVTSATGKLALTRTGTDRIGVPKKFTFSYSAPVSGITGLVPFALTSTLITSPVPVGLTFDVTHSQTQASSSPTHSASGTSNGGQPEGSGTPAGAPATGGGTGPAANLAVAAGGGAIAASGGGLVLFGKRRTRQARTRNRT